MSAAQKQILNDTVRGPARRAQLSKSQREVSNDPIRGPATQAKRLSSLKVTSDRRVRTKWRHALRHPLFLAYRERVNAMPPEGTRHRHKDRLRQIDAIDKAGTTEQKRKCLRNIIFNGKSAILPHFYRKVQLKTG